MPARKVLAFFLSEALAVCALSLTSFGQAAGGPSNAAPVPTGHSESSSGYNLPPKNILDVMTLVPGQWSLPVLILYLCCSRKRLKSMELVLVQYERAYNSETRVGGQHGGNRSGDSGKADQARRLRIERSGF